MSASCLFFAYFPCVIKARFFLLFLFLTVTARSQDIHFSDSVLDHCLIRIPAYELSAIGQSYIILKMDYGKSDFADTSGLYRLKDAQILSIDLLFTDYPNSDGLRTLNLGRLKALQRLLPSASTQPDIRWQVIRQMNGSDRSGAQQLLHGFVINYRAPDSRTEAETELKRIDGFIRKEMLKTQQPVSGPRKSNWAVIHEMGSPAQKTFYGKFIKKIADAPDSLLKEKRVGDSIVAVTVQQALEKRLILPRFRRDKKDSDSLFVLLARPEPPFSPNMERSNTHEDSSVIRTLERITFKNSLVVADVTGSMSPWMLQLLEYLSDHEKKKEIRYFSCFNDGNNLPDDQKKLGATGGVYTERFTSTLEAAELISMAMQRGRGGDLAENVCEAMITAAAQSPGFDNIVLIADRWAPVRDIELVDRIPAPVHIVACGNRLGIHPDYVTIAVKTKGSIHFMDEDIVDFSTLLQGKEMMIKHRIYYWANGRVMER